MFFYYVLSYNRLDLFAGFSNYNPDFHLLNVDYEKQRPVPSNPKETSEETAVILMSFDLILLNFHQENHSHPASE